MGGGILDVAAGVLHILAKATDGAATGACESENGAGDEQEGETLMGCFHSGDVGVVLRLTSTPWSRAGMLDMGSNPT